MAHSIRERAFQVAIATGTILNIAAAIPLVFSPSWVLTALSLPPIKSFRADIWVRDAGVLLLFLSLTYIPAVLAPLRHRWNAGLAVIGRLSFAAFWGFVVALADYPRQFLAVMIFDASLGGVQAVLYLALLREAYLHAHDEDAA